MSVGGHLSTLSIKSIFSSLAKVKQFNRRSISQKKIMVVDSFSASYPAILSGDDLPALEALGDRWQQPTLQESKTLSTPKQEPLTLPKTNMAMDNLHFQQELHLQMVDFPLPC